MTNVSRKKTDTSNYTAAYEQLIFVIANLKKVNTPYFFDEFFTEAEKVVYVKRFVSVFMFQQGHFPYRVSTTVSLSLSTTQRIFRQYQNGHFDKFLSCLTKTQKSEFSSLLEDFILSKASGKARARLLNRVLKKN